MTDSTRSLEGCSDSFLVEIAALPPLPRVIQYEDDYDEKVRSIKVEDCRESVTLFVSGQKHSFGICQ